VVRFLLQIGPMKIDDCRHPICHCCADHLDKDGFCSDECRMRARKGLECACGHCGDARRSVSRAARDSRPKSEAKG
jgi:hypothetical protein